MLALAPLWVGLVQLVPVPVSVWGAPPGREVYLEVLAAAQAPVKAFRPLSLVPDATWLSVLAGIPLTAVFLLAHTCTFRQLNLLARALVVFALTQTVLGLLQLGPFPALYFEAALGGRAIGSFAIPNHFESYIAMCLPLAIFMLRQASGSGHGKSREHGRRVPVGALWGVGLFLLLAAVLASSSRGGTTTALVVTLLAVVLLQASCGLGLLASLLHSWVDFNLRIPANAISAAFLLGAFLRPRGDRPATSLPASFR